MPYAESTPSARMALVAFGNELRDYQRSISFKRRYFFLMVLHCIHQLR